MGTFWQDIRFAVRTLIKRPAFTVVAVATIAVGIGANTAIFSLVNGVLLRPFPLPDSEELVTPNVISSRGFQISLSIPNFRDWSEQNRVFESMGANTGRSKTLTGLDRPEVITTRMVLGDYFETLGVRPFMGRLIRGEETWEGAEPIAVVSHGFWQRRMGGDPDIIGKSVALNAEPFTIVGVLPEDFAFPTTSSEVFLPTGYYQDQMCWDVRGCSQGTWAIARLKDGVTLEAAQADMDRVVRQIQETDDPNAATAELETLVHAYVGDIQDQLWLLMGAVGFVLLIAGANVANLLIARGEERRREIAVRIAMGAAGRRVVQQLLTESLLLAGVAGLLGIGVARVSLDLMIPAVADRVPSVLMGNVGIDGGVLAFTAVMSLLVGAIFGAMPALRATRSELTSELREGGRGGTGGRARQRSRSALVVGEVALSLVLLIGAGLMVQSLGELQNVDKGFNAGNIFTAKVGLPPLRYGEKELAWPFFEELERRVEALPGVLGASVANTAPLAGNNWEQTIWPEGVDTDPENGKSVQFTMASPDHTELLDIPLLMGRRFTAADQENSPHMAIIDETMAETFWPGENPIGKRVTFETTPESTQENPIRKYREVVGVVANVRHYELESPSRIQVYIPTTQTGQNWSWSMVLLVKTAGDPQGITALVRHELAAMDSEVPLTDIETLEGYVDSAMSGTRLVGGLLSIFSALALGLAGMGLFGVISFSVSQRMREIGVRMALGAEASQVVGMVAKQGLGIAAMGAAIGLAASFGLTSFMSGMLFEVNPVEPVTFAGITVFLLAVSVLAAYVPARRATRIDPAIVLREE